MFMHTGTRTSDVSFAREFQKYLSNAEHKHGVIDQVRYKKEQLNESGKKWNIMFRRMPMLRTNTWRCFYTNQFSSLPFCGPHTKPHGVRGLSKHYHMIFDKKLGHEIWAIILLPCAYAKCTSMIYKTWIHSLTPQQQLRYQPVIDFAYWPLLWSFKIWNIIT